MTGDYQTPKPQSAYPRCALHGTRIVDFFPPGCPYGSASRRDALDDLQADAWARLMQADPAGLDLRERLHICEKCRLPQHVVDRLRPHDSPPASPPVRRAPQPRPVALAVIRKKS